jgi:uncharacterized protein YukJ
MQQLKRELEYIEYSINGMFKDINSLLSEYLKLLREASPASIPENIPARTLPPIKNNALQRKNRSKKNNKNVTQ